MKGQWFWFSVMVACVGWYLVVTAYVAIRGGMDIRSMLRRLSHGPQDTPPPER